MLIVLARHGNTFAPGEPVVWVGGRTDLPLVEKGRTQAKAIGAALRETGLSPRRTIAGPLLRTRETAALALEAAGLDARSVEIDERLREIDYGRWEAKGSDEIRAMGDGTMLAAWEDHGTWPSDAGWPGSLGEQAANFRAVFEGVVRADASPALIVSSNGIFRLAASWLVPGTVPAKVATGAVCVLRATDSSVEILCWNVAPERLAESRQRSAAWPS